jgi:hypothetical protein
MRSVHLEELSKLKIDHMSAMEQERARAEEQISLLKSQLRGAEDEAQNMKETLEEKISGAFFFRLLFFSQCRSWSNNFALCVRCEVYDPSIAFVF